MDVRREGGREGGLVVSNREGGKGLMSRREGGRKTRKVGGKNKGRGSKKKTEKVREREEWRKKFM